MLTNATYLASSTGNLGLLFLQPDYTTLEFHLTMFPFQLVRLKLLRCMHTVFARVAISHAKVS